MLVSPQDQARVAEAVAQAERATAGEIYCVLAARSDDYPAAPLVWATGAALLLPPIALLLGLRPGGLPSLFGGWTAAQASPEAASLAALVAYIVLQAAVFVVAALVVALPSVRERLTGSATKAAAVRQAAMTQFLGKGLHLTRDRTGVLLYVSVAERRAEVIADENIYTRAPREVWDAVVADLTGGLRRGDAAEGFVAAVGRAGAILAEHFPPRPDDVNEVPDALVLIG